MNMGKNGGELSVKRRKILFKRVKQTSARLKVQNYIQALIRSEEFQTKVLSIRRKYGIPDGGIAKANIEYFQNRKGKRYRAFPIKDEEEGVKFKDELLTLCEKDYLLYPNWTHTICNYILYNIIQWPETEFLHSLCSVYDLRHILTAPSMELSKEERYARLEYHSRRYPVAIFISPYAGERDIVEYAKKAYKLWIEPLQKKHENPNIRIGKTRARNGKKDMRNKYIAEHPDMTRRQIQQTVEKRFDEKITLKNISMIRSRLRQERKQ